MATVLKLVPPDKEREPRPTPASTELYTSRPTALFTLLDAELDDEATRWRRRTTTLASIIVHAVIIIALPFLVKLVPVRNTADESRLADLLQNSNFTFLQSPETPPAVEKPKTDVVSDRNRVASARNPQ